MIIIYIRQTLFARIGGYPAVQRNNLLGSVCNGFIPAERGSRQYGCQDYLNAIGPGQLYHRNDVAKRVFLYIRSYILSNIIRTGIDDHHFGVQLNDIFAEAQQELIGGLPADASSHVSVFLEELRISPHPTIRNGVSHKDNPSLDYTLFLQHAVLGGIALQVGKILVLRMTHGQPLHQQQKETSP